MGGVAGVGGGHFMHRPSHPHNAGAERVGFFPTRQTTHAPSAKRRGVSAPLYMNYFGFDVTCCTFPAQSMGALTLPGLLDKR